MENKNSDKNVAPVSASQVSTNPFSGPVSKTTSQQSKVISIGGGSKDAVHSTPPPVPPRPFKIASTMKSTPISDKIQPESSKMCSDTQSDAKPVKESPKPFRTHRSNSACVANTTIPAQFASRIARRNTQLLQAVSIVVEPALHHSSKIRSKLDSKCTDLASRNSGDSMDSGTPPSTPITKHVTLDDLILEPKKSLEQDEIVKSIMASARLRKEEFARLLEEHAQIVNEINRVETSLM